MARVALEFDGNSTDAVAASERLQRSLRQVEREAATTSRKSSGHLNDLERSVGRAASSIERSLIGATRRAAIGIGLALGTASTYVGYLGLSFYRTQQQASIAFTTMLGDAGRAKKFLADLADFARVTPFEFKGLIQSTQQMMAMGFEAKEIIPSMTAIGDAVAALGGTEEILYNVTRALGQMRMSGRVNAQDMNQLTQAGIAGWRYLAEAAGVSVAEIRKASEKGAVDGAQAVQAILAGMNRDFQGMMDEQSRTFTGRLSTLKDSVAEAAATGMTPFFEVVERGMARVNDELASPRGQEAVRRLAGYVERELVPAVMRLVDWIIRNRNEIADLGREGADALMGLFRAMREVGVVLREIADLVGGWDQLFILLLTGRLALKVQNLTGAFTLLAGSQAAATATAGGAGIAGATGWATRLIGALNILKNMGPIAIPVIVDTKFEGSLLDKLLTGHGGKTTPELIAEWIAEQAGRGGGGGQPVGTQATTPGTGTLFPVPAAARGTIGGGPGQGTHNQRDWQSRNAVDIFAAPGTPVLAPQDGHVIRVSGSDPSGGDRRTSTGKVTFGYGVTIQAFRGGQTYYYAHLDDVTVRPGDRVRRGQVIGYIAHWKGGKAHVHAAVKEGNPISIFGVAPRGSIAEPGGGGARGAGVVGTERPESGTRLTSEEALRKAGIKPVELDLTAAEAEKKKSKGLIVKGLDAEQTRNAQLIFDMARRAGLTDQQALELVATAYWESGLRTNARNKSSGAMGLFQLLSQGYLDRYAALRKQGLSAAQANIAAILPDYVKFFANNPGARPGAAGAAVERSGMGAGFYARGLGSKFRIGEGGFTGFGGPGPDTGVDDATGRLAEARELRKRFAALAAASVQGMAGFDDDTKAAVAKAVAQGNETIRRAFKDRFISRAELDSVKGSFDRLTEELEKGVERAQTAFTKAWDRFRSLLSKAMANLGPQATLERRRQGLVASDATALIGQVLGSGDVTDDERRVAAAAERVQRAWKAYSAAVQSGNRQAIEEAAAELAEAEKRFESLEEQDLQERAQRLFGAYRDLIGVIASQEQQLWETMTDEQQDAVDTLLEKVQEQLASGKITYGEARRMLTEELAKLGIDVENIGGLLGEPFQQAMIRALGGIESAVNRLIAALRGLNAETAALGVIPQPRPQSTMPGEDGGGDWLGPSRLIQSALRPSASVGSVTPVPVRQAVGSGGQRQPFTFAPTIAPQISIGTVVGGGDDVAEQIAQVATSAIRDELSRTQQRIGIHGKLFAI